MDRKRFGLILLAGTALLTVMGYGSGKMAADILNNVSRSYAGTNIFLDKTIPEDVAIYTPQFYETSMFLAKMYADYFGIESMPHETQEYYLFADENESLYVYKFTSMMEYMLNTATGEDIVLEDFKESDALKAAEEFVRRKSLFLDYEDASVNLIDGNYEVKFMNRLGNSLRNYGFPNEVTVDKGGRVTALTYHFITYERLGNISVMSMREAFNQLYYDRDTTVINSCRMVYVYKDSILQPAYMFQGKTEGVEYFESFVEAAFYGIDK